MDKKSRQEDVLLAPDKKSGETYGVGGILAGLFRQLMEERNIDIGEWGRCMHRYLQSLPPSFPGTRKDHTNMRGNIAKELLAEMMTFKVFCKGLVFLALPKVTFAIEWHDRRGRFHRVARNMDFGDPYMATDEAATDGEVKYGTQVESPDERQLEQSHAGQEPGAQES